MPFWISKVNIAKRCPCARYIFVESTASFSYKAEVMSQVKAVKTPVGCSGLCSRQIWNAVEETWTVNG